MAGAISQHGPRSRGGSRFSSRSKAGAIVSAASPGHHGRPTRYVSRRARESAVHVWAVARHGPRGRRHFTARSEVARRLAHFVALEGRGHSQRPRKKRKGISSCRPVRPSRQSSQRAPTSGGLRLALGIDRHSRENRSKTRRRHESRGPLRPSSGGPGPTGALSHSKGSGLAAPPNPACSGLAALAADATVRRRLHMSVSS